MQNLQGGVLDDDAYKQRGAALLAAVKKYDPNASWSEHTSGGEGGQNHDGYQLNYDYTKLPKNSQGYNGTFGLYPTDNPSSGKLDFGNLKDPSNRVNDVYGWNTPSSNHIKAHDPGWTKVAPIVVGGLAGLGSLAAAAGLPAAEGGASAVTGSAAGLGAGNIASGAGSSLGTGIVKGLPTFGNNAISHNWGGLASSAAGLAGSFMGMPQLSEYIKYINYANQARLLAKGH